MEVILPQNSLSLIGILPVCGAVGATLNLARGLRKGTKVPWVFSSVKWEQPQNFLK